MVRQVVFGRISRDRWHAKLLQVHSGQHLARRVASGASRAISGASRRRVECIRGNTWCASRLRTRSGQHLVSQVALRRILRDSWNVGRISRECDMRSRFRSIQGAPWCAKLPSGAFWATSGASGLLRPPLARQLALQVASRAFWAQPGTPSRLQAHSG